MLKGQENDDPEKILATNGNDEYDMVLAKPRRVRRAPNHLDSHSVITTGDFEFNESDAWLRGSASERMAPKTRVGLMSKMKCGGIVFSAGFKAERYKEAV